MVESKNDDEHKCQNTFYEDNQPPLSRDGNLIPGNQLRGHQQVRTGNDNSVLNLESIHSSLQKSLIFFVRLTAKFPLVIIFLLIILYAIPASAAILALYILVTVVFALPPFLLLYFAYPSLDWLIRELVT